MIAMNYRKFADALIAQMELDFSGAQDVATRSAWWSWLMNAGTPKPLEQTAAPAWWRAMRRAAKELARAVKAACIRLDFSAC